MIPDENDSEQELHQMCQWLVENLGVDVPLHFSAFHPDFKMLDKANTPLSTLLKARDIALSYGMNYVYCGNVHHSDSDTTVCPNCKNPVIVRDWYVLSEYQVNNNGNCLHCGHLVAGCFDGPKGDFGSKRIPVRINN